MLFVGPPTLDARYGHRGPPALSRLSVVQILFAAIVTILISLLPGFHVAHRRVLIPAIIAALEDDLMRHSAPCSMAPRTETAPRAQDAFLTQVLGFTSKRCARE